MTAKSVVDVILGEAKAGSYEDMLAIASVIENRARQLGVTPEEVVSVQSEFNAYGKNIPSGNDAYRNLAEQALQQVRTSGPVHEATFYATPQRAKGLPSGLEKVTSTDGHRFYSDPKNRSIRTSQGFRSPEVAPLSFASVGPAPPQAAPRNGQSAIDAMLSNAAPPAGLTALEDRPMAGFIENYGPKRPNTPSSGIQGVVRGVVGETLGPEYSVRGISGEGDYGAKHRHPTGKALDYDILDPSGNLVTDPETLSDVAVGVARRTGGSTGFANDGGYMGLGRIHSDFVRPQSPSSAGWSRAGGYSPETGAQAIENQLYQAALSGGVPRSKPDFQAIDAAPQIEVAADALPVLGPGQRPVMAALSPESPDMPTYESAPQITELQHVQPDVRELSPISPNALPSSTLPTMSSFAAVQPTMSDALSLNAPMAPTLSVEPLTPSNQVQPVTPSNNTMSLPALDPVQEIAELPAIAPAAPPSAELSQSAALPGIDAGFTPGIDLPRSKPKIDRKPNKIGKLAGTLAGGLLGSALGGPMVGIPLGLAGGALASRGLPQFGPIGFDPLLSQGGYERTPAGAASLAATRNGGFNNDTFTRTYANMGGGSDSRSYSRALAEEQRQRSQNGQKTVRDAFGSLFR